MSVIRRVVALGVCVLWLAAMGRGGGFEVWIADQSDTAPGHGGQLLIYEGSDLYGRHAEDARPIARRSHSHAVLSFVASGHVVIFDAERRTPLQCLQTSVGSTGTRQAHAAFPAPDGSFILVANQNGKRLERIDADFATNTFAPNPAATLDLATCVTPSGRPCEHPDLRPPAQPLNEIPLRGPRLVGAAIVVVSVIINVGLLIGALVFMASGQTFEQFQGL
jgi:hypothetical protein